MCSLIARKLGPVSPLEALFVELSVHDTALALGTGHSVVAAGLSASGTTVDVVSGDWPSIQLTRRYTLAIVEAPDRSQDLAAAVHCAAQHVGPGGELVLMIGNADHLAERFDLRELDRFDLEGIEVVRYRRTDRVTVHDKVFAARSRIG